MAAADSDTDVSSGQSYTQHSAPSTQHAKEHGNALAQQRQRFPLSYKEGFNQWWSGFDAAVTEHRVLSFIPFLQQPPTHTQAGSAASSTGHSSSSSSIDPSASTNDDTKTAKSVINSSAIDPYGPRRWTSSLVPLGGKDRSINEFSVERLGEDVENNLVMLHGYGAGLAFWYKNYESLSRLPGWRLFSLDLLGMGRSSRPPFRIHAKDEAGKIAEAENWFIDALEDWRKARRIERFTLMGHSMGGYMATAYALKYPGHLNKLILVSPVGIPEDPYAVNESLPEPTESTMMNEFTQDQDETTSGQTSHGKAERPKRPYPRWLITLWDANISPFSIVRWAGPLGPKMVSGWTTRRFSHLPQEEAQALHDYSYSLFRQRGSGEYVLAYVLAPGAFARSPLIRRIQGVGRQYLSQHSSPTADPAPLESTFSSSREPKRETGYPVVFVYGENDWMDVKGGYAAEKKIKNMRQEILQRATQEEKKADAGDAKVMVVPQAGHHVYLDGWEYFNDKMKGEMEEVSAREKRRLVS